MSISLQLRSGNAPVQTALVQPVVHTLPLSAKVVWENNAPRLYINGKCTAPVFYGLSDIHASRSYTEQAQRNIAYFAEAGVHLVQVDCELRACFREDAPEKAWIDPVVKEVAGAIRANSQAAVIIRLHMNAPVWWMQSHRDELNVLYNCDPLDEGHAERLIGKDLECVQRVSLASEKWKKDMGNMLASLCEQLQETPEGDNIIGIQVACGVFGEWHQWGFWEYDPDYSQPMQQYFRRFLKKRYGSDAALQKAWNDPACTLDTATIPEPEKRAKGDCGVFRDPQHSQAVIDSLQALQSAGPDAIIHFASIIKKCWKRDILTGSFYGYFFTIGVRAAVGGHLEVHKLLEHPDIDYLSAPFSYHPVNRKCGGPGISRSLLESIRLNRKLWLTEMDQPPENEAEFPGGGDPALRPRTIALLRRNTLEPLSRGMGFWFYDHRIVPGGSLYEKVGWWEAEDLRQEIAQLQQMASEWAGKPYTPSADVLLVFDTEMFYHISCGEKDNKRFDDPALFDIVLAVSRSGAAFDSIYLKDLEKAELDRYKTVIFAGTPLLTDEQKELISRRLKNNKRHLVWCYAPGFSNGKTLDVNFISELTGLAVSETGAENPALAPAFAADEANRTFDDWSSWYFPSGRFETEEIREIFECAGVHIYSKDFEDVIVGNFGTAIHTAHGGKGTVCLRNGEIRNVDLPADSTIIIG